MPTPEKQVRVFVSSTFRDMHAERDHLVTVVFPELRERIEMLGLEFFDVDLRWGVPEKDVNGETANSWEYCRQWIDRVEPLFVCILGQRYGWVPKMEDFKDKADRARQASAPRSITDLEVRHAVLKDRRKQRSYFYLRKTPVPALSPDATAEERKAHEDFVDPPGLLEQLKALKTEIGQCGRPVRSYACRWTGQSFNDLDSFGRLVLDDFWSGVLRDSRYVSKEVWRQALGADPDTDPRYTDESHPVPQELGGKIVALARPAPASPLDEELQQMEAFGTSRLKWFQGRDRELETLTVFLRSTDENAPRLAVAASVPGQGKSALLAYLHKQLKSSPHFVITHFVGATERSATAHALVERLLGELDRSGITWPSEQQEEGQEPKRDFNSLCLRLAQRLGGYAGERRIVILLDALNQLTDRHDLQWLPTRLGPSVRVIVSCVEDAAAKPDSPEQRVLHALASRQPSPLRVALGPLTEDDVRTIVVAYLKEYCHELDGEHLDTLCAITQARNPLYLLVMLNELRTLGGNDLNRIVPALITSMPQDHPDTVSLFRWVLQRLEVFGPEAVRWWCLYLAHGRIGMASHELADLLGRKLGADAVRAALRIERGLRRYLQRRGRQLDFFHGQLRQAVFEQYGPQAGAANVHADIATYFRVLADPAGDQSWKGDNPRPFLEVAFHLAGAQRMDELCRTLCDLGFIEARCVVGQVFELVADYRLAQESLPETQVDLREERAREERARRWTAEIVGYARQWSDRRDRLARGAAVTESEPRLPETVPTCEMWSEERIQAECERTTLTPTRRDRLEAFAGFVSGQCYPLLEFGKRPGFVAQHAFNQAPAGPVHEAAMSRLPAPPIAYVLRRWAAGATFNPKAACLRTLEGHSDCVNDVSVTPDGRRAASGSADHTLRVWDLESGACLRTLEDQGTYVWGVSVTPDVLRAVSWSRVKTLHVWDLESGACLRFLGVYGDNVISGSVTPDGRRAVLGSADNLVRVWDLESRAPMRELEGHSNAVNSVSVTPDGRRAVSGSADNTLRVWDLESGSCLRVLGGHSDSVRSVSLTPDGQRAVSGSGQYDGKDNTLRVWDLESGACLRTLEGHSKTVNCVTVTPDGRRAVSGSDDDSLRVWDLESGVCLRTLEGNGSVNCMSVTPDGRRAIAGSDRTLRVWDLESGICLRREGHSDSVMNVSVTPDGRWAISGSLDRTLRVWDLESEVCVRTLEGHSRDISCLSVTPDGRRAISGSLDRTLRVWDLASGACLRTLEGHRGRVQCASVTPDGRRAVSGGVGVDYDVSDKTVRVWNLETGACLRALVGHIRDVWCVSAMPDGRRAISGSLDRTLRVWDLESGACLRTLVGHTDTVTSVNVTPDGRRAVSGSGDHTLRVWDLESGACLRTLEGHFGYVNCVDVTPDGRRAVSVDQNFMTSHNTVRVWNVESGACLHTLEGHGGYVNSVTVTPDGQRAILGSEDYTLRVWDLESGACLGVFLAAASVGAIASHSGTLVAGLSTGDVVFAEMWNLSLSSAILTAANPEQARCPMCGQEFAPPPAVVTAIRDADAPGLLSHCPHCRHPLQFNPFFAAADDYAEVLRRGLDHSRREKGPEHEETLAHLAALAAHFEQMGQPEAARPFAEEHACLAALIADR